MHLVRDALLWVGVLVAAESPTSPTAPDDDAQWLHSVGLGHLEDPLRQHGLLDPSVLVLASRSDLVHAAGLRLGDALRLQEAVASPIFQLSEKSATVPARGQPYLVTAFGAVGDGKTDDTAAIQAAVDAALATGGPELVIFPPGVYILSQTINATGTANPESFRPCSFAGQSNPEVTVLRMGVGTGGSPELPIALINFRGGSGGISHAYVERLTLAGATPPTVNATGDHACGIKFAGQDGVVARQLVFTDLSIGAWFYNEDGGAFTEYCQVHDSEFAATVLTALKYQRSPDCPAPDGGACGGSGSFHGSGMQRCVANWDGQAPFIHVASPGVVYNAPWDFQVWYSNLQPLIVVTNETFKVWPNRAEVLTHGTITIEGQKNQQLLQGGPVYHAGVLEAWMDSNSFDRGDFFLVSFVGSDADGGLNIAFQPHSIVTDLEPGNTTVPLPACGGGSCIIDSRITAPYYVWMRTHLLSADGYGDAFLTEIAAGRSFDQTGKIGPVVYKQGKDANGLTFCNDHFPGNGSTVLEISVLQLRQPLNQVIKTQPGSLAGIATATTTSLRGRRLKTDEREPPSYNRMPSFRAPSSSRDDWSPISVTAYGAAGDGKTDDADAIQQAINAAVLDGSGLVLVPPGDYLVSHTLCLNGGEICNRTKGGSTACDAPAQSFCHSSFRPVTMRAVAGASVTRIMLQLEERPQHQTPVLLMWGGSGALCGAEVVGLTLQANVTTDPFALNTVGLEFRAQCGAKARHMVFTHVEIGVMFHNMNHGDFTEYCQVEDSWFNAQNGLRFQITDGNPSFNGAGLRGCTANEYFDDTTNATEGAPPQPFIIATGIKPNISGSDWLSWYNAPCDFQIWWARTDVPLIRIDDELFGRAIITTHGTITIEHGGAEILLATGGPMYHAGSTCSET